MPSVAGWRSDRRRERERGCRGGRGEREVMMGGVRGEDWNGRGGRGREVKVEAFWGEDERKRSK